MVERRGGADYIYLSLRVRGLTAISQLDEEVTATRQCSAAIRAESGRPDKCNDQRGNSRQLLLSSSNGLWQGGGS